MKITPVALALGLAACSATPEAPAVSGEVSWPEALRLLEGCEVTSAFQTHQREVTLTLNDGTQVETIEPRLDAIFDPALLGPGCPELLIITE